MNRAAPQPPASTLPSDPAIARRLSAALAFAHAAGDITLNYFQTDRFEIDTKRDGTAVTTADREAEQHLRALIAAAFPDDGIIGEEFGDSEGSGGSDFRWILDPIDGTASFVCGVPLYGTLVAVEHRDQIVAGVIHMPALRETVYAGHGGGAWHVTASANAGSVSNAPRDNVSTDPAYVVRRARVSNVEPLERAVVCITGWEYFARTNREDVLPRLGESAGKLRGWSDCYAHILVATGRAEGVVEPLVKVWDVAPAQVVMRESGGRFTDFAGRELVRSGDGILSNGRVHDELLGTVNAT